MNQKTETFFYNERTMKGHLFHVKQFPPVFSERMIQRMVKPGEKLEDSFTVRAAEGVPVTGFVSSSQPAVRILTPEFSGEQVQIRYTFQAKGRSVGDQVKGYFRVISDQGEYRIPYIIAVDLAVDGEGTPVRNLSQFAAFAEKEPEKALELFYDRRFLMILKSLREYALYRGYSAEALPLEFGKRNAQNLEGFLTACGAKTPVKITSEQEKVEIRMSTRRAMDGNHVLKSGIRLTLQGWGFVSFPVHTEGSFLSCPQDRVRARDFQNNDFVLPVEIERLRLHAGNNFGAVVIGTEDGEIRIPVTVKTGSGPSGRKHKYMETQETLLTLVGGYEAFCTGKIGAQEWFSETETMIGKLSSLTGDHLLVQLYRIHLRIVQRKTREAADALDGIRKRLAGVPKEEVIELTFEQYKGEDDLLYCYRQYLTALCYHDEQVITPRVVRILQQRWRRNPEDWQIAWLLMDLSMSARSQALSKYRFMRSLYENGCRSPLVYLEAFQLMKETPSLLSREAQGPQKEAAGFEVQVLRYAYRRKIMTPEVLHEVCVLAVWSRRFSKLLFDLLTDAYGQEQYAPMQREVLETICIMLVKNAERAEYEEKRPFFHWVEEGIRKEVPVTGLESAWFTWMPEDYQGEIPEEILLGLKSPGMLPWPGRAYYYRYLYEHRYRYPGLFDRHKDRIGPFADEQRAAGHRSPNLTFLYALCLKDSEINGQLRGTDVFIRQLFCVYVRPEAIRRIADRSVRTLLPRAILVYDALKGEQSFSASEDDLVFAAYSDHYSLYLADQEGNRYRVPETDCLREYTFEQKEDRQQALGRIREGGLFYRLNILEALNEEKGGREAGEKSVRKGPEETESENYTNSEYEESKYEKIEAEELPPDKEAALREAAMDETLLPRIRREICVRLLNLYIAQDRVKKDDVLLLQADPETMTSGERGIYIKAFNRSGHEKTAIRWLTGFGTQGAEDEALLWAADALRPENGDPEIALEAVRRGKTDADVLLYLNERFNGLLSEMEMIRKASEEVRLDVTDLTGKMLSQMLFTGEQPENRIRLVEDYRRGGGEPERIRACLAQFSYEILSGCNTGEHGIGQDIGENIKGDEKGQFVRVKLNTEEKALVRMIGEEEAGGRKTEIISRLLFLRDADLQQAGETSDEGKSGEKQTGKGETPGRSGADGQLIRRLVSELLDEQAVMPFLRRYSDLDERILPFRDITMYTYFYPETGQDTAGHLVFHFAMEQQGERAPFSAKIMRRICDGLYVTGFVLFFGEQLHFFITDDDAEKNIIESGVLSQETADMEGRSDRFALLNRIAQYTEEDRQAEAADQLKKYYVKDEITQYLFHYQRPEGADEVL